jgi:hypothetical protein
MSEREDASVLSRWSKRKHQAAQNKADTKTVGHDNPESLSSVELDLDEQLDLPSTLDHSQSDEAAGAETATTELELAEEPILSDEDMPALSSLNSQSDISMFFNKGVSAALRKAALKTIFGLPQYNIRDGLNDYDEDYTVFEPLGDTVTCDMKFHQERKEREEREAREREAAELEAAEEEAKRVEEEKELTEDEELAPDDAQEGMENDDAEPQHIDNPPQAVDEVDSERLYADDDPELTETTEKRADV